MRTLSIRQRLTLWYVAAVAVLLAIVSISLVEEQGRLEVQRLDADLGRLQHTIASVLQSELDDDLPPGVAAEEALDEIQTMGRHLAILTRGGARGRDMRSDDARRGDGTGAGVDTTHAGAPSADAERLLAQRWTLPWPATAAIDAATAVDRTWTARVSGAKYRIVSRVRRPVPDGFVIVTAATWDELNADRTDLLRALLIVVPFALIAAAAGAWWVAGRALRPAAAMAEEAHRITEHSSGARLSVARDDELGQLATAFNALVDRLATALDARRRFLADTSHDLRTPISIARTAADVALSRQDRSEAEYRESLAIVAEQMARLGRMVGDMLTIARSDAADWPIAPQELYVDELVADVVRAMRLLADERQVRIDAVCPDEVQFRGDEGLLRQMLCNLVENAVRHTPPGGSVTLSVTAAGAALEASEIATDGDAARDPRVLTIDVRDTGAGIPAADRERIFDRFVRIDPAGAPGLAADGVVVRNGAGFGLGLPIARRIARVHGGDVTVAASSPGGTTFRVTLPCRSAHEPTAAGTPAVTPATSD